MKRRHFLIPILLGFILLGSCVDKTPRFRIGVSQCSDDEWRHQMNHEIIREVSFYDDVEVYIRTAKDNNTRQAEDIRKFIEEKIDLLIVAPNEATPITPVVEEAYNSGIPVIVVDRKILSDKYSAYVGADNYALGKAIGNYIVNLLEGNGTVVEICGLSGSTPAIDRHQGFMNAISMHPGIQLLAVEDGQWLRQEAQEKMDSLLARFPRIDVVYAHNDRMAAGAYTASKKVGREKEMKFIGTDALSGEGYGVEQVLAGELDATFIYPTGGDLIVQIAMDILNDRTFPRESLLVTSVVDPTNAPIMKMQTTHIATLDSKIETLNGKINQHLIRYDNQQILLWGSLTGFALVVGLLIAVYHSLHAKNRLNIELSLQKEKLEQQKQELIKKTEQSEQQKNQLIQLSHELETATHAKLVFFTNISHDFRTPLTLIADPIDQLLADESISHKSRQLLGLVQKNVNILLRLVNRILDFRKVENGRMEFHAEPFDLAASFREWNDSFRMALLKKHISFTFNATADVSFRVMADIEKMECIYFNLVSNAVKYTPENGKIRIALESDKGIFRLTVFNSGSYIAPTDLDAVFERFYQVERHKAGTGIGLALVRAFVEMHGGNIVAHSDEKGTTFIVSLPQQQAIEHSSDTLPRIKSNKDPSSIVVNADISIEEENQLEDSPQILLIDDNTDVRTYIKSILAKEYRVVGAGDAIEGIQLAMKYVPDFIISDVMMPGIDGIECCRRLKNEFQTCHIPVILLTACSLDEQRIQGYDGGADSYISKPFNSHLLLSRVRNLIANRQQLKQFFGDVSTLEKENISQLDKDFVSRFKLLIEKGISNPELNVEDLGREMGMSRVQLYRKLKSLTNYSPNELLRQIRLMKASSLLASSQMSISEIAYEVGFTSPSYFTKCYKEQFGENPKDFVKRKKGIDLT